MSTRGSTDELIWHRWQQFADTRPDRDAIIHWIPGEAPYRWTFGALHAAALAMAWQLRAHGVRPGDVCALIMRHHPRFYPIYLGVSVLGALPAVLAYPNNRLHPVKYKDGLAGMSRTSGLDWILTERDLDASIRPVLQDGVSTVRDILFPLEWEPGPPSREDVRVIENDRAGIAADSPVLLQHSSGTTGLQKAIVLSHRAVLTHVSRYGQSIRLGDSDRIASWLPLYHDMGLIAALHLPLASGIPSVHIDPFQWVRAPVLLFEALSAEGCTLAWLPNFAYNLMADSIHDEDMEALRLDSLRMVINCSEPVRADSQQKFLLRFSRYGLRSTALAACYAMAETTFAITQTEPDIPARTLRVNRDDLSRGIVTMIAEHADAPVRVCVSSGRPIEGCQLRILAENGADLPNGFVGEVAIRSVSMFSGYNQADTPKDGTSNDWHASGDLGFAYEGEYFIVGRLTDIIIVAGNNIYPEDVEDAVGQVSGVIPGRVVAFGEENVRSGTERIVVVAETDLESAEERDRLRRRIVQAGMQLDLTLARVYLAPPRWLIKSSSGKPSRKANSARIQDLSQ